MQVLPRDSEQLPEESDSGHFRILLAEDHPGDGRFLVNVLMKAGYSLTLECNGQQVLRRVSEGRTPESKFDLVIMDLAQNRYDIIVAAQRLRAIGFDVPILALSLPRDASYERECLDAGINVFLEKPVSREQLLGAVARLVVGREWPAVTRVHASNKLREHSHLSLTSVNESAETQMR